MDYILGVDGGNTKTDYYIFDNLGNIVAMHRDGTCSHEGLADGFEGSYRVMKAVFDDFLPKYNLKPEDFKACCFGLAGVDIPYQEQKLREVIERMGFKNFVVVNDSTLGVKAGTTKGYGACSINGTGTAASGIDMNGEVLQVGGIGEITGDEGGGRFIARKVVRKAFDEMMRFGPKTSLTPIVLNHLGVTDKLLFMQAISEKYYKRGFNYHVLTLACFDEANKGDKVAISILEEMGDCLARNVSSVIVNKKYDEHPEIVLAGSVYVKGSCPVLVESFKKACNKYTQKECSFNVLQVPPATGAIIWAKELYDNKFPTFEERQMIIKNVSDALEIADKKDK